MMLLFRIILENPLIMLLSDYYFELYGTVLLFQHYSMQMNECLTTPQRKNKIGYWVSKKWYLHRKVKIKYVYIKIYKVINTV